MKRNTPLYLFLFAALVLSTACKKNTDPLPPTLPASVTVVNAALDLNSIQVDPFTDGIIYSNLKDSIPNQSAENYTVPSGNCPFTVVPRSDTTHFIVNTTYTFSPGGIYSLYIGGQAPKYDTLMVKEGVVPTYTDSAIGIRLINLAPDAPAISMSLAATPMVYDVTGLGYRQESGFKKYPLPNNPGYSTITYNVWDPATSTLLASYTLPSFAFYPYTTPSVSLSRFKAMTLVFTGLASGGYSLFSVTNY